MTMPDSAQPDHEPEDGPPDAGHLLPDQEWDEVVADAAVYAADTDA